MELTFIYFYVTKILAFPSKCVVCVDVSADKSWSPSVLGYDVMYNDTGAKVSKYLATSVFRVFVSYFLAARIFRFKNHPIKMQAANSSESSITSNQYMRRHIPEQPNLHKKKQREPEFCNVNLLATDYFSNFSTPCI